MVIVMVRFNLLSRKVQNFGHRTQIVVAVIGLCLITVIASIAIYVAGDLWSKFMPLDNTEREIYLIPNGYEGPVLIIFNQPDGEPQTYEGQARIYAIPRSGILRTQFARNVGGYKPEFWYVDEQGRRAMIPWAVLCRERLPDDPIVACLISDAIIIVNNKRVPSHRGFIVGPQSHQEKLATAYHDLVERMILTAPAP